MAVTMTIGMLSSVCRKSFRISTPLVPGMLMSRKTTSGRWRMKRSTAAAPEAAVSTSKPAESNVWRKPTAITGASPGAIGTAVAQSHLRNILLTLGAAVMGGEAYITFKPGLIDAEGVVSEERVRVFLQAYIDRFAGLVERHLRP